MQGKDYWEEFKKRRPDLFIRTPDKYASNRLSMINREIIEKHFNHPEELIVTFNLKDKQELMWNCDETGLDLLRIIPESSLKNYQGRLWPDPAQIRTTLFASMPLAEQRHL